MPFSSSISIIAEIESIEKIPLERRINVNSTYELVQHAATEFKNKAALIFLPEGKPFDQAPAISYQQFLYKINQVVNLFTQKFDITANKTVSFLLPNLPETFFILIAAETSGIANPIAPMMPPEQIAELLILAQSELLITAAKNINPFWENILVAREIVQRKTGKELKLLVVYGKGEKNNNIYDFNALLEECLGDRLINHRTIHKNDVCAYFHTSGTTGAAKLVKLTHWGKLYMAWAASYCYEYKEKDVILAGLPLFHVGAGTVTGNAAFMTGATVVLMSPMGWMETNVTKYFWQIVEKYRGTITAGMSFHYSALLDVPINNSDVNSLRLGISGTAVIPEHLKKLEEITKAKISEIYGLTESTCFAAFNPVHARRLGSMGLRFPYEQMKVISLDAKGNYLRDCTFNEEGLLVIKGPNVTHYQQEEFNKNAFIDSAWFKTGDIVKQDDSGYFWMICRTTDAIYRNGIMISSLEIEKIFLSHPQVANVAVLAMPDAKEGEVPVAIIVLKTTGITADQLKDWLYIKNIPDAYLPVKISIVDKLPINGMGKVLKYLLMLQAHEQLV